LNSYSLSTFLNFTSIKTFRGNGKLLLTGEYGVLDGARALALPTKLGQVLKIKNGRGAEIIWHSQRPDGTIWFKDKFSLFDFSSLGPSSETASFLTTILKEASRLNSDFLSSWKGMRVETFLEFEPEWGLGSSSTLIYCIAIWADVNPFHLHFNVSGGSGYDIACAGADAPITYRFDGESIQYEETDFDPPFKEQIYFIYQGSKKSSAEAVDCYKKMNIDRRKFTQELSQLTDHMVSCKSLADFDKLIDVHEELVSKTLNLDRIQSSFFDDYWGKIKSLGAWGGDFVLATSSENCEKTLRYFQSKGHQVIFPYHDLIKQHAENLAPTT
jgi:mevalonate kinase